MKHHVVLKLRQPLANDLDIPDWLDFINDKSVVKEDVNPDVDRLMDRLGLKFWLTREYKPAGAHWSAEEQSQGLNRTYRMILQQDYNVPPALVKQIRLIPSVESARELQVGEADLPDQKLAVQASYGSRP